MYVCMYICMYVCMYRISSNKRRPLINALAGMYLILINDALLINAAAFIMSKAYSYHSYSVMHFYYE